MDKKIKLDLSDREQIIHIVLFCLITILFIATRLFRLDSVPYHNGMHIDEWGAAYDAWCIQGWGVDRFLTKFPVYFYNTGQGQNALYIYLAALMFKFFGFSLFKFRLIAVICATIAYFCMYGLSRIMIPDKILCLVPNALMTVLPVFVMSEHWGLESYLFLSFSIISFYFMIIAISKQQLRYFVLDGILWGITFYSYGVSYVIIPIFMVFTLIYLIYLKKVTPAQVACMGIPMIILGIPLAVEQLVIEEILPPIHLKYMDFLPMERERWGEVDFSYVLNNLVTFPQILLGKDYSPQNYAPGFGTLYYISIPFMIIGLVICIKRTVVSVKKREFDLLVPLFAFFMASLIMSLMIEEPSIHRSNSLYFPLLIFTALGILFVISLIPNKNVAIAVFAVVYCVQFLFFARWAYSYGENSWCGQTTLENESYLYKDVLIGIAVKEAKDISGDRKLQMIINMADRRIKQICLFAGTSPYDYQKEGYDENNYSIGIPDSLDYSGQTVYLIEAELHHITDYLVEEQGFTNMVSSTGKFSIVYK